MPPAPLVASTLHRSIVLHVVTAAGLVMALTALGHLIGERSAQWMAASIVAAVMVRWTVQITTRKPSDPKQSAAQLLGPTMGWSMVMGMATTPAAFIAAGLIQSASPAVIPMAFVVAVVGAHLGLALGLLFGLLLCVPVTLYVKAQLDPSDDAGDTLLLGVGVWLVMVVLLCATSSRYSFEPFYPYSPPLPFRSSAFGVLLSICAGLGALLALGAAWRRALRRRWVAAVARQQIAGWRLVKASSSTRELDALPCLGASRPHCDHLLHRCEDPGQGAYRRAETSWPVAWIPRAWVRSALTAPRG